MMCIFCVGVCCQNVFGRPSNLSIFGRLFVHLAASTIIYRFLDICAFCCVYRRRTAVCVYGRRSCSFFVIYDWYDMRHFQALRCLKLQATMISGGRRD